MAFELLHDILKRLTFRAENFADEIELKMKFIGKEEGTFGWRNVGMSTFFVTLIGFCTSASSHSGSMLFSSLLASKKLSCIKIGLELLATSYQWRRQGKTGKILCKNRPKAKNSMLSEK